jgi:uncharacterized protein
MQFQKEFKDEEGLFFLEENGERLARMFIRLVGSDRFVIEHTEVSPKLKGRGVGGGLVEFSVNYARENKLFLAVHRLEISPLEYRGFN